MKEKRLIDPKKTRIFEVVTKIDDGKIGFNPVGINSPDWVTIIVEKSGRFLVEKQLRYGLMKQCEEFPCGMVEKNEKPIKAAIRELAEETGIKIKTSDLNYLGKFAANPAFMNNHMHYFYVNLDNCGYEIGDTKLDEHEKLITYWKDKDAFIYDFMKSNDSVFMAGALWLICYNQIQSNLDN